MNTIFSAYQLGSIELKNRIVMAPMTRSRAIGNMPNEMMATYYGQRATAGLIISEGIAPSPNGLGYSRIPGIFTAEQTAAWKQVTDAVHEKGGKIFAQIMHTGRISHPANLPEGARVLAPSAIAAATTKLWVDGQGELELPTPVEMTAEDIENALEEYAQAARNAVAAGFDGIELHGANGYLLKQFLNANSNQRTDEWGGSVENRSRFVLETVKRCINAIGKEKVGIRISPYNFYNDMAVYDEINDQYTYLAAELQKLGIVYLHIVDTSAHVPQAADLVTTIRGLFKNTLILNGGYDAAKAEAAMASGKADLIAMGSPFLANPDLINRIRHQHPLSQPDYNLLFSPGAEGYIDYQPHEAQLA